MLFPHLSFMFFGLVALTSAQTTTRSNTGPATSFPLSNSTISAMGTGRTTLATVTTQPTSSRTASVGPKPTVSSIGNIAAPPITAGTDPNRPFVVNGNTFDSEEEAVNRACAIQNNMCADAVNSGKITDAEVSDCSDQETVCINAGAP